jgi:hypothetical protein
MSTSEAPVTWRKSSYSQNGDCIESADGGTHVFVRDSEDPCGPTLNFRSVVWATFIAHIKSAKHPLRLACSHSLPGRSPAVKLGRADASG